MGKISQSSLYFCVLECTGPFCAQINFCNLPRAVLLIDRPKTQLEWNQLRKVGVVAREDDKLPGNARAFFCRLQVGCPIDFQE